jgi:hypothetical protein
LQRTCFFLLLGNVGSHQVQPRKYALNLCCLNSSDGSFPTFNYLSMRLD